MFAFIKGKIVSATPLSVILEANSIGYKIFIPSNIFSKLPQIGETFLLHTTFVVREFAHTLYGFPTSDERDLFEALTNVTGIGPKLSLSLIGHMERQELSQAIHNRDIETLCKVPGIGKKTAERLIIEMRDKLPTTPTSAINSPRDPKAQIIQDAMSALINLGYNQVVAQKAIKKSLSDLPEPIDLSKLITFSLKNV